MRPTVRAAAFFAMVFLAVLGDQCTKHWALGLPVSPSPCELHAMAARRCGGVPQPVIAGFWDWQLAMNDGAAFSSFRGSEIVLSIGAIGALLLIGFAALRTSPTQHLRRAALAMIAGGAAGNLIDRLSYGSVVDFVRWHYHDHDWPIFNVADVLLVVGVALMAAEGLFGSKRQLAEAP
jgi:signal peptidase II